MHIGTSGWRYDHWRGPFYPEDLPKSEWLAHYAKHLGDVEVNTTFYGLPERESVEAWVEQAGGGFGFAVKASRYITHMKKLKEPAESLDRFFEVYDWFGGSGGPVLFQLPGNWNVNAKRLESFLGMLPGGPRYAFEFRDPSWHCDEIFELLRSHGAAFVFYELAGFESPREVTADFVYMRRHGPGDAYQGEYGPEALSGLAGALAAWRDKGIDCHVYFDNDQNGYAAADALRLAGMLDAGRD
jgi:uncharacterized protein YecE (DUF72 family)